MQNIDEPRLETDLGYRFAYVTEFIGLGEDDLAAVLESAEILGPLVPALVDAVYEKLYQYDATWRHFVPRQHGYEGEVPASLEELTPDHPQIVMPRGSNGLFFSFPPGPSLVSLRRAFPNGCLKDPWVFFHQRGSCSY